MSAEAQPGRIGIVVIGRNEGERLIRCLRSIGHAHPTVYVDSGSDDGSRDRAEELGYHVVRLDPARPYSAARARNAGLNALIGFARDIAYVQMIDGDCELQPDWLAKAASAMDADESLAATFGRRRELFPDRSLYNWLCDVEWAVPPGRARAFGGDVLLRRSAIEAANGYCEAMIAGEDPDLSIRLRRRGGYLLCLDAEMTLHDADLLHFGQWWRRSLRAGYGFADLVRRHPGRHWHRYRRNVRSSLFWGGLVPLVGLIGVGIGLAAGHGGWLLVEVCGLLTLAQIIRLTVREARQRPLRDAATLGLFLTIGKYAEAMGIGRYHRDRLSGRPSRLIEYKGASPA